MGQRKAGDGAGRSGDLGLIIERLEARGRLAAARTRPPAWAGLKAPIRFGRNADFG
jgi:hypothetical protein